MSKDEILNYFSDINYAYNDSTRLDTLRRMLDGLAEQAASPWHRVEEELPEIGQLILLYYGGCYSIAARTEDEMWERKRYWKLEDGYWERIEDDYYWMPIEPPKEDA